MKQRISVEDLQQLTEEQKERLREWWKPQEGDWFFGTHGGGRNHQYCGPEQYVWILSPYQVDSGVYGASLEESPPDEGALPLLSIGQLIELLDEKDCGRWEMRCSKAKCWHIASNNLYEPDFVVTDNGHDFDELIDALWEAVKQVL